MTPGISLAIADCVILAVTNPIATVATAPMARRANIMGNVNVIDWATLT
jgi:hypothetical protein